MAKKKSKSKDELEDALANTLADSINKQFKGQALKTAFFLSMVMMIRQAMLQNGYRQDVMH